MRSEQLHSKILGLVSLIGLMGLWGCSKDEAAEPKSQKGTEVQLMGYVAGYDDFTRAWTPPTGFSAFDTGDQSISVFFTQGTTSGSEEFFYKENGSWKVSLKEKIEPDTYYFYGYMPHDKSINTTVSVLPGGNKTFANGAVVTMTNVPTVSPADFCVMIGAKNGYGNGYNDDADYSITELQRGNFTYTAAEKNYVYLLFDHLFSALRLQMRVQGTYNDLRTIKLKELKLKTFKDSEPSKKKTDITITLTANIAGNDPITDITFTPSDEDTDASSLFTSEDGYELTADYQEFTCYFMPQGVTKMNLISTYDVYDKKGNLVRPNCTATNTLDISTLSGHAQAQRRCRYTIKLTINPTYLYMLSEPDLDNPTVTVE